MSALLLVGLLLGPQPAEAGTIAPPLTADTACPWGSDDCNVCVPDAVNSIGILRDHGDPMGFHMNGAPDVSAFNHWQGLQRLMSGGGNYLAVSRSIPSESTDVAFAIIEMGSRNADGLRFRSNRLGPSDFEDTPPPLEDGIAALVPHEPGYTHAGGIQVLGNILAVPFEGSEQVPIIPGCPCFLAGCPCNTIGSSKVVFYDLADPLNPVRLQNDVDHTPFSFEAGTASLGRLADGRILLVIGRADANTLDFYVSTTTDARTTAYEWFDTWNEDELLGGDSEFGNYQNLSILAQCDGTLHLIGTHENSSIGVGEDFVDLYRLENAAGNDVRITKVANKHLFCDYRGDNNCNLDAAGGIYVDPEGRLFIYGTEHDNDGPSGSVKMAEFRPVPHGPCDRIEDAWVELYDDEHLSDRSVMIDFVDRHLKNYRNLNSVEDFEDRPTSVRWCIPHGAVYRLWQRRDPCEGNVVDLVGTGSLEPLNLHDVSFGDAASCSEWLGGPFADAGPDQTVECASHTTTPAMLDGSGSASVIDETLSFFWFAQRVTFDDPESSHPVGEFPPGSTVATLLVSDSEGIHGDTVEVHVVDTTPPAIACPPDAEVVCGEATDPGGAGEATATDVCDPDPSIGFTDVATPTAAPQDPVQEVIERTWTATDDSVNLEECPQHITVLKRELFLDIKPGSCTNPLDIRARGSLPMSVLGTADFEASTVDPTSLRLVRADGAGGSIAPIGWALQDTATPYAGDLCGCHRRTGDGIADLSLRFDNLGMARELQLDTVAPNASVQLILSGVLSDGCEFIAADCMIRTPVKSR